MNRPIVFVSSTILDFRDLRGALKYWLEDLEFDVQLSEHTDFDRKPDLGTFEACFDIIRQADYYILLVGHRPGQLYDESSRISVTRQEYREALASFERTGKPRIIALARSSVLTVLHERERAGANKDVESTVEEPDDIAAFVAEVEREPEVKDAAAGLRPYPAANWVSSFSTFRDITDVLKSTMHLRTPLSRMAVEENLRHELESNLRQLLEKRNGRPLTYLDFGMRVRKQIRIERVEFGETIRLTRQQVYDASIFAFSVATQTPSKFRHTATDSVINSGLLLEYDRDAGRPVASEILLALHVLREKFEWYERRFGYFLGDVQRRWSEYWDRVRGEAEEAEIDVRVDDLASVFGLIDTQTDLYRLTHGVLRYMYGHSKGIEMTLRPVSPVEGLDAKLQDEEVSEAELKKWLTQDNLALLKAEPSDRNWNRELNRRLANHFFGQEEAARLVGEGSEDPDARLVAELAGRIPVEEFIRAAVELISGSDLSDRPMDTA